MYKCSEKIVSLKLSLLISYIAPIKSGHREILEISRLRSQNGPQLSSRIQVSALAVHFFARS